MAKKAGKVSGALLALVLIIALTVTAAAPAYAGGGEGPNILGQTHDIWAWTGEVIYPEIHLDGAANNVNLYYWSSFDNDWVWHQTCNPVSPSNLAWYGEVNPAYWADDYITLRFAVNYDGGVMFSEEFTINWTDSRTIERIAGSNRFATAREIAYWKRLISGGIMSTYPNAVIACGTDFADALGGAYLAAQYNAPILLVNNYQNVIDDVVMELMSNLSPGGKIFILGGEAAVSDLMVQRLAAAGFSNSQIERFAGANRYDTNLKILEYCGVYKEEILVCSGMDFPDALSASAVGLPILLAGQSLTDDQLERIGAMKPEALTLIGGTGAVSAKVEQQLSERFGAEKLDRVAGKNRYQTSQMVAMRYFADRQRRNIVIAFSMDFPDGLAGGPFAYQIGAPLVLADKNHYDDAATVGWSLGARDGFVLGGPTLIPNEVADKILPTKQ